MSIIDDHAATIRDIFANEGITDTPTRDAWTPREWVLEVRGLRTRRETLDEVSETRRARLLADAEAFSINLDEHEVLTISIGAHRGGRGEPALDFDLWVRHAAEKIPAGFEPTRLVYRPGKVAPSAAAMSAEQFSALRHLIGLSDQELANILLPETRVARTVRRWLSGASRIGEPAARRMRELVDEHTHDVETMTDIPDGPRPRGWYVAVRARQLDRDSR